MFKSLAMMRVELLVPERHVLAATEALAESAVFHPGQSPILVGDTLSSNNPWVERGARFTAIEQRLQALMEELSIDIGPVPAKSPHPIEPEVAEIDIARLEREAEAPVRRLAAEQRRLAQLRRYLAQLESIENIDVDLGQLRSLRYTFAMLGSMPSANVERLQSSLEHIPSALIRLREQGDHATVILFGQQSNAEILNRAARSAYLDPLSPPEGYRGTPAAAIKALRAGIARTQQHITESRLEVERLHESRIIHILHLYWRVRASRTLAQTIAAYDRLHDIYLVQGWVPARSLAALRKALSAVSPEIVVEATPVSDDDSALAPASMRNPALIRPFEGLVSNYGYPRYRELDPTPLLALTFPLVFGLMFGDIGHGMLLTLLGLLVASGRIHALARFAPTGAVIAFCGGAATIFGFLYGSFFGFENLFPALWIRPLSDINRILIATVVIGATLLSLGMLYNIVNAAICRRWGHLLFDHHGVAGLIFYWSLLGLGASAFGVTLPLSGTWLAAIAALSGLALVGAHPLTRLVEGHRPLVEGTVGLYLAESLFELFETLIGMFSNTLSYVRMGAFAVAHGALSLVVLLIAGLIDARQGVVYYLVVALGSLFVTGFEGMIVTIQTLRLEYYEFFSKFFTGSGTRFQPLQLVGESR